ncbi:MAG: hypothetical protein HQ558_04270 [Candidatus Omnitrophica bacterium]|nr:hypothetical protein [Candidatus Omnitrophota bacterium]
MKILKITLIILVLAFLSVGIYVYMNRSALFDHGVDKLIKNLMPSYLEVEDLDIDLKARTISIKNFKVLNPKGFEQSYLVEIPEVNATYTQKDESNILKGIIISDIDLMRPVIYFQRSRDRGLNVQHMDEVLCHPQKPREPSLGAKIFAGIFYIFSPVKKIDELLELKPVFNVRSGTFIFDDRYLNDRGYMTTIEEIESQIRLRLKDGFEGVDYVESEGKGLVNGRDGQSLHWVTAYNPNTPELTMSNDFKMRNVDFVHFAPYYDKFSPFIFRRGRASGEMIFNFDSGNIGSTNELRFYNIVLEIKEDFPMQNLWAVSAEDLYRYFTSSSGEIVFDFKIKGPVDSPKFYLGSKTKRALANMVVGKIRDAIYGNDKDTQQEAGTTTPSEEKSDAEKILDLFRGIVSNND